MGNPVVHWEIGGREGKKLQEFYGKLFDWNIQVVEGSDFKGYGIVDVGEGGIGGGIFQSSGGDMPTNYTVFYVQVDDLQASLDKAGSLGAKTVVPPTPIPDMGAFALFSDPDGNVIGLFKGQ
jgi:predicted enzyme related to lactoylglutathione lyase